MEDLLRIGVVTTTHGIKGEVKVFPTTDDIKRFKKCDEVILITKEGNITLHVESVKYFKNMVILKFKQYDNINDILKFKGLDLLVSRENAIPLGEDEYFIVDLIGCNVVDEEKNYIGELVDVMETGANGVYVVKTPEGREVLFPVIEQCVLNKDIENKTITVHVMKGLMD